MALGTMRRWKRHEILFRAGDPMSSFFKIKEGVVAASLTLDDGRRQIVANFGRLANASAISTKAAITSLRGTR